MNGALLKTIYAHPLFLEADYDQIVSAHRKVVFDKGDIVLRNGQIADGYYIIEEGLMRSFVNDYKGNDITIDFFTEKELAIAVSSLFQRVPSQENIEALTDCSGWKIDFGDFQGLFHTIEGMREWGRSWMSKNLFECKQRSVAMITDSATQRYLHLLETRPKVIRQAPLKHIASYLGVTDTSLSRIRKETAKR